ncbi:MAG: M16 family metallopeptidase [bacterium]
MKKSVKNIVILALAALAGAKTCPAFQSRTELLSNGLKVVMVEDHKSPVVTFQIWYKVGSKDEKTGRTGISHVLEHMMFKGTAKVPKGRFSRIVAQAGGTENAFTGKNYTAYFEKLSSDRLDLSLELEPDRMTNLLLDPKEFKLELAVVKEERRSRTDDDPTSAVIEDLYAAAFKVHPYRNPVIGWMTDLNHLTVDEVKKYYRKYYAPNNAVISVVGDFNPDQLLEKIKKTFGSLPRGTEIKRHRIVEPKQIGERRFTIHKQAQLPFVFIGYHVPNLQSPDQYPLEVLNQILSSGKSSRLYKTLVYDKKIALYAGSSYSRQSASPDLFYFYGGLQPKQTSEEFERSVYEQLNKMKTEPVSDRELQKAKNQVQASFVYALDSSFYQAMRIGQLEVIDVDHHYLNRFVDNIQKVTAKDILRVAGKYFSPRNRTVGVLIPESPKNK